jgi:hypothetical protein
MTRVVGIKLGQDGESFENNLDICLKFEEGRERFKVDNLTRAEQKGGSEDMQVEGEECVREGCIHGRIKRKYKNRASTLEKW